MPRSLTESIRNVFNNSPPVRQARAVFHIWRTLFRKNFAKKEEILPEEIKIYARICEQAYISAEERMVFVDGFEYIPLLSTDRLAVYYDEYEVVLAVRGTVLSYTDVRNDLRILVGEKFSPSNERIRELIQIGTIINEKFPSHSLVITGHSLGATLGNTVADELDSRGYFFNIGASPYQSRTECRKCKYYVIDSDPISLSALSIVRNKQIYIYSKQKQGLSSHTIQQFT